MSKTEATFLQRSCDLENIDKYVNKSEYLIGIQKLNLLFMSHI